MRARFLAWLTVLGCRGAGEPQVEASHHHGHEMHHRFQDAEAWAKEFDDPERASWQKPDEVVALMAIEPGMVVADLGAGTGYFEGRLSAAVPSGRVLALDVEPDMVRYLEARIQKEGWPNVTATVVAPDDPGLAEASVDRILIVDTWHHLGDRDAYARRLAKALRPGGRVQVVDYDVDSERGPPAEHKIPAAVVAQTLEAAGLSAAIVTEALPDQYMVVATKAP